MPESWRVRAQGFHHCTPWWLFLPFIPRISFQNVSQCDAGNKKNAISLWFKWINIPSADLFCTRLSGHIECYSSGFICDADIDLWPIFWCLHACRLYDRWHSAILTTPPPPPCLLNTVKRANEIKVASLYFLPPLHTLNKKAKIRWHLVKQMLLGVHKELSPKSFCLYLGCSGGPLAVHMTY